MSGAYPYPLTKQTLQAFSYVWRQINTLNNLTHWLWTHPRFPPAHQLGFSEGRQIFRYQGLGNNDKCLTQMGNWGEYYGN